MWGALQRAGIFAVLLKGRAFAALLYDGSHARPYDDVDLLVSPDALPRVGSLLREWGFEPDNTRALGAQTDPDLGATIGALGDIYGETWIREQDGLAVDVHDSLPEVAAPKHEAWEVLNGHLTDIEVAHRLLPTLDPTASALLAALHAGHHGPMGGRALKDLERAVTTLEKETWIAAHTLAVRLRALPAFGAGLGLLVAGRELAAELGVHAEPTASLRVLWRGAPWGASFLQSLADARGFRARIDLLKRVVAPSHVAMRRGSKLARRGRRGLAIAYAYRLARLLLRLPWAAFTLLRSRLKRW